MFLITLIEFLFAAVLGAVFGSFVNVVAIRTHDHSSLWGRSHCMHCNKPLGARHLVPVISWLVQRGRCTDCGKAIHIQYPMVEVAGAIIAVLAVARNMPLEQGWLAVGFEMFFGLSLLVFLVMDARWKVLPLEMMVGTGIVFSLWNMLMRVAYGEQPYAVAVSHLTGFAFVTLFFLFQWIVSRKRWIGSGDIWLGAVLGAVLGWPLAGLALYFAYVFGGAAAVVLLITKKIKTGTRVPFAPALVAGALAAIWWGPDILTWFSNALS